jgi:3D (Asp-Asp-Asp) domain-containing protein
MSNIYNPVRGFFIGKVGKSIEILAVAALLAYPASIKADTAMITGAGAVPASTSAVSEASTASSTPTSPAAAPDPLAIADSKTVWVTAYTSAPDETSDHPLITASGGMVRNGVVAANFLPFGTQIEIPSLFGNKVFVVEDRTSQKFGGRVDIWMPTVNEAINFGIQHAQIVILDQNLAMQ